MKQQSYCWKMGAEINAENEDGDTPLHWAAWRNVYEAEGISLEDQSGINPQKQIWLYAPALGSVA